MLRYRQKLIKVRTMTKNSLQAIALQAGLAKGKQLFTKDGQAEFKAAAMSPALQWQRDHWLDLLKPLNQQLLETMVWFKAAKQRRCGDHPLAHSSGHRLADCALPVAHAATCQSLS